MNQKAVFDASIFKKLVEVNSKNLNGVNKVNIKRKILSKSGCEYIKDFNEVIELEGASDGTITRYFGFLYQRLCAY